VLTPIVSDPKWLQKFQIIVHQLKRVTLLEAIFSVLGVTVSLCNSNNSRLAYLANVFQAFAGADVPFPTFLDFRKYPRFYQGSPSNHNAVNACGVNSIPIVFRGKTISASKNWYRRHLIYLCKSKSSSRLTQLTIFVFFGSSYRLYAFFDIIPVRQLGIPLLTSATMQLGTSELGI
jgi:hypothetical protein